MTDTTEPNKVDGVTLTYIAHPYTELIDDKGKLFHLTPDLGVPLYQKLKELCIKHDLVKDNNELIYTPEIEVNGRGFSMYSGINAMPDTQTDKISECGIHTSSEIDLRVLIKEFIELIKPLQTEYDMRDVNWGDIWSISASETYICILDDLYM